MSATAPAVWGGHMGKHVGARPVEKGYVGIGWPDLGDLRQYNDRDAFKQALAARYADEKPESWPVRAGVLFRFAWQMKAGDLVVCPSKHDRMVNVGRFSGVLDHLPATRMDIRTIVASSGSVTFPEAISAKAR